MMDLKGLREELGKLQTKAMAVVAKAEREGRELTDAEQKIVEAAADSPTQRADSQG